jgi:hypothetical protein
MIPSSPVFDQSTLASLLAHDPLIAEYRVFFALLDWSVVEQWEAERSPRGRPAHPESAYLKAFLLRIREGMFYTTQLRRFLLRHPLLIIELGFRLVLDDSAPYGFDVEQTLPCEFWLREKRRAFDPALLQDTVHALKQEIPGLGETVAFDVNHIYAWVKENNERAFVPERYDKTKRQAGDPDCRLGVKHSTNKELPDGTTDEQKELIWGYGTGIAVSTVADYGTVVLADYTLPFNEGDVTSFRPLYQHTVLALGRYPTNVTADAAYDAWYVYEVAARHGGIAAVPLSQKSKTPFDRMPDGTPRCPIGLPMYPTTRFNHTYGYRAQRFQCPLLFPEHTGQTCHYEQFRKGKGCVKDVNWELGGKQRALLDRTSPLYQATYAQRTSCELLTAPWYLE